jgi:hypothetical protein
VNALIWIPRIKCGAGPAGVYPDGNRDRNDTFRGSLNFESMHNRWRSKYGKPCILSEKKPYLVVPVFEIVFTLLPGPQCIYPLLLPGITKQEIFQRGIG